MDFEIQENYPLALFLYFPYQYLAPVYLIAFTCYYLKKYDIYILNRNYLFAPFIGFFILYTILKINIALDYTWVSKETFTIIYTEVDVNSSLVFNLFLNIWSLIIILQYENSLKKPLYDFIKRKTDWIKIIVIVFITLNAICFLTVIFFLIRENINNLFYYSYWISYLAFYYVFLVLGYKKLDEIRIKNKNEEDEVHKAIANFQMSGVNHIFSDKELELIHYEKPSRVTGILSYFSTSLFDKNNLEDVLWDVVENCISHLQLEDCIIYILDNKKKALIQKAAYGNKNQGERKILSPIEIPLGKGIVGQVALTGEYECIYNVDNDNRYILDDINRKSELAVPIVIEDKVVGVLDSEHSQEGFFNENHILLFQLIVKLIAKKLAQINLESSDNITNDDIYFKELHFLMKEAKIYRDSSLGLDSISRMLNISSNYLSQLINRLNGSNFSEYVNNFRIEDVKSKLKDPKFANYTILSIALEAGFNSKSNFYTTFKKHTGIYPKEYRETS